MPETTTDPREARTLPETLNEFQSAEGHPHFRVDLERIRFSPFYSRLSAVTQVISQAGAGLAVHNRLTHSVKVAAVARAIATHLSTRRNEHGRIVAELGGAHAVVVQAAAAAHDLGHPPFGHLGEQTLDRLARTRFGLTEGFEGNAQTYRIITRLDEHDRPGVGLNLTAAVRAAVLKYPWRRGQGGDRRGGSSKFNHYAIDEPDVRQALAAYPRIEPGQQTVECSIMDISDDIAYSLHDLDDFYRAGLLNPATLSAEFRTWHRELVRLRSLDEAALVADTRTPGHSLELLWRQLRRKDAWIADPDAFAEAVAKVSTEVIDGLVAEPFDGSLASERSLARFTTGWIARLQSSIEVHRHPDVRSGHVSLSRQAWHEVAVLKFLHQRFILERPDLAVYQRGQASVLERLVDGFAAWLDDLRDARRAPRRLIDLVDLATDDYRRLARDAPELAPVQAGADLDRRARGRGIIDYVASLTDAQATSLDAMLAGRTERLWDAGQGL
ncbi:deoxyguanosinetriphosphate triphosphohydrolase family protein [Microbacterium sp. JB110]|uniref:deoxyguanosinetriphosphate triphosphohydrolase family protein n=1 Tax=Microbacterium sp. JB110 TaxID=2024477 RepID=UPI00097EEFA3|nr:dNTP triphosphohydrolase [Microbacterium sp. JB110]RCS62949.1 dNTP triphosphohydrolase [Microbacterium sp. JB110]SJM61230.1 Deoxyguanosinetriphosphate triphosphohydrolase [Frigoribacterium sp. JB110]